MPAANGSHLRAAPEPGAAPVLQVPLRTLANMATLLAAAMGRPDRSDAEVAMGAAMIGEVLTLPVETVLATVRAHPGDGLADELLRVAS